MTKWCHSIGRLTYIGSLFDCHSLYYCCCLTCGISVLVNICYSLSVLGRPFFCVLHGLSSVFENWSHRWNDLLCVGRDDKTQPLTCIQKIGQLSKTNISSRSYYFASFVIELHLIRKVSVQTASFCMKLVVFVSINLAAAEAGKMNPKYESDQRKLRALNRYYKRFGKVCNCSIILCADRSGHIFLNKQEMTNKCPVIIQKNCFITVNFFIHNFTKLDKWWFYLP